MMRRIKQRLFSFVAVAMLAACSRDAQILRVEFLAMGTTVSVSVADGESGRIAAAVDEVESLAQRLGHEWYPWTPDGSGELAQLNAALAQGKSALVSPELANLLRRSRELFSAGDGYFDPAVEPLVKKWGFDAAERRLAPVPSEAELADWAATRPSFADLDLAGAQVSARTPQLQLDLGAVAKGRVVDLCIAVLQRAGIENALIDAGGNLRAIGAAGHRPWRMAIRDPRGKQPLAWVELARDESASTSGDYERFALVEHGRIHHLLDPHTGRPVTHTRAVTVLAGDATTADAASTAIMAAGPERWLKIARQMRLRYVLRIGENGDIEMSSGLRSRLHFSDTFLHEHKISLVDL